MAVSMTVAITRKDMSARELRTAAAKTADAKAARRLLAIALVLEGVDRKTAAESCGMDRQTLRDWGHRYNAEGLEGLSDRRSAGPTPRLSPAQKVELAQMVRKGPDPVTDGVVRGRRADLQRRIKERASASHCTSAQWASSRPRSDFAASRCVHSIRNLTPGRRTRSKKLRRNRS